MAGESLETGRLPIAVSYDLNATALQSGNLFFFSVSKMLNSTFGMYMPLCAGMHSLMLMSSVQGIAASKASDLKNPSRAS